VAEDSYFYRRPFFLTCNLLLLVLIINSEGENPIAWLNSFKTPGSGPLFESHEFVRERISTLMEVTQEGVTLVEGHQLVDNLHVGGCKDFFDVVAKGEFPHSVYSVEEIVMCCFRFFNHWTIVPSSDHPFRSKAGKDRWVHLRGTVNFIRVELQEWLAKSPARFFSMGYCMVGTSACGTIPVVDLFFKNPQRSLTDIRGDVAPLTNELIRRELEDLIPILFSSDRDDEPWYYAGTFLFVSKFSLNFVFFVTASIFDALLK